MRDSMTSDAPRTPSPLFRPALLSAVTALVIVLTGLLILRAWVWPQLDRWREQVQWLAGAALGRSVQIEHLTGVWNGLAPAIDIRGLRIDTPDGTVGLSAVSVRGVVSPAALWSGELRFSSLVIEGPVVHLRRHADGTVTVAGWRLESAEGDESPGLDWLLRQGRIRLDSGRIEIMDLLGRWPADRHVDVTARLERQAGGHRVQLRLGPADPPAKGNDSPFMLTLNASWDQPLWSRPADVRSWSGQAHLGLKGMALEPLAQDLPRWLGLKNAAIPATQGRAALQIWSGFTRGRSPVLVMQAELDGLRARPLAGLRLTTPPLDLRAMLALSLLGPTRDGMARQARVDQISLSDGQGLKLNGEGQLQWPASGSVWAGADASIELAPIEMQDLEPALRRLGAAFGLLPVPQDLRLAGRLEALHLRGAAGAAKSHAEDASAVSIEARFSGLAMALGQQGPDRPSSGVSGLSGKITWHPGTAKMVLDAGPLELSLPQVWSEPTLRLTRAQGEFALKSQPAKNPSAPPIWTFESPELRFATEDLNGTARLRWVSASAAAQGSGQIQLQASIDRVAAARISRYLPVLVGPETRRWIARAVQAGSVEKIEAVVQGDLTHFPFRDPAQGVFRMSGRLREVGLDYAPGWPALQGLEGMLVFERGGFEVQEARARIHGVTLGALRAGLADYREGLLSIEGQGEGQAQTMLDFIDRSPLSRTISTFTRDLKIQDLASIDLALQIPLDHPEDTRVRGGVTLNGNDLILDSTLPPFQSVRGRVAFTESDLALRNLRATFLGGPLEVNTVPGNGSTGSLRIEAAGRIETSAIRALLDTPLTQALEGSVPYHAEIDVDRRASTLLLRSDLKGLASSLPVPLNKQADRALAFEVRSRPLPAPGPHARPPGDRVEVRLGSDMQLALERRRDAATDRLKVQRAGFGMGVSPVLRDAGMTVSMQTDQFDFDAWGALLARTDLEALQRSGGAQALPGFTLVPDWVSVVADTLRIGGQTLNEVVIGASRQ